VHKPPAVAIIPQGLLHMHSLARDFEDSLEEGQHAR